MATLKNVKRKGLSSQRKLVTGEAACFGNLGTLYEHLGEYDKAEEYQKKSLVIRKEIGDRKGEATCYGNLGNVYY